MNGRFGNVRANRIAGGGGGGGPTGGVFIHEDADSNSFSASTPEGGQELLVLYDSTTLGAGTVTLPAAPNTDSRITVKDTGNSSANNITVDGNGNDIDGSATTLINSDLAALTFHFDGADWWVV